MDSDSWSNLFSSSNARRYQSRSDLFGHEEMEGDDEIKAEFLCPFCAEDFDVVGLCCHIDEEHPIEAKNGVCPVCAKRVGANLVTHITTQHGSLLKVQRKRKFRRGSNSTFSILRKELREGSLQALLGGSSFAFPSNTEPDPLLSSFIYNAPDEHVSEQPHPLVEAPFMKENIKEESSERIVQQPPLSTKDQEEKARKCKFVQGLLMSTILDDL
ncbi:protein DEHYDRATION-INDUCED 19 homolog 4-like [Argentina anserina]|uniref:protein DEHYDRATION-INDUCED 19 homolog 4-like n=1 Tax=Argentina anserina TaxID=57926 RepID=UPI002176379A|nr:protein DEHYDRATION-INDUCED 19 homolog 4-like [Potentilla anserina]